MEIKNFISNLAFQFDEVEESEFTPETNFKNFDEWSSLISLSVIAMVDDEYNVVIKADEIKKCNTVQDLFDLVNSKKN